MPTKKTLPLLLCLGLQLALALPAQATVETSTVKSFKSAGSPLATAASADGHLFFVLTTGGKVEIYEANGTMKDTITLDAPADGISSSPSGDQLFLSDKASGQIRVLAINFVAEIEAGNSPFKGPEKAPVTVTVFSDFQCPYCAKVSPLLDQIVGQYPKEVKVVHKNFPLKSHQFSLPAAIAALAAHRQGKFWEMHDAIFANYASLSDEKLIEFAKNIGLDLDQFGKDRNDPRLQQEVQAELESGMKAEVRGTPTIFVNGRRVTSGGLEGIKSAIDKELHKVK